MGEASKIRRILFLAQLPPPFHGQSQVAGAMHKIFTDDAKAETLQLWRGGARSATDVGTRSISKYLGFAAMICSLFGLIARRKRFEVAYLGVAPWAHTILRDAILIVLAKLVSRRVWVHVHGDGLEKFTRPQTLVQRTLRWVLRGTELLAITSDTVKLGKDCKIFNSVIHLPNFAKDPGIAKKKKTGSIHLGTVGNLDPRKGVFEFLACISALKSTEHHVRGTMIGGPTNALSVKDLRQKVEQMGLADTVTVTGRVDESEKNRLLSEMDIFLYPSRHDLAPLSLIEALSHACVPIVFETGGIPEIVGVKLATNVLPVSMSETEFTGQVSNIVANYISNRKSLTSDAKNARAQFLTGYSESGFRKNVLALLERNENLDRDPTTASPSFAGESLS